MKTHLVVGCSLAVAALLAGCQSSITGTPVTSPPSPTEPSFPTPRPSRTTPTPSPTPTTTTTSPPTSSAQAAPPGTERLRPSNGYVYIETKSGQTRCQLNSNEVDCESQFTNSPQIDGEPANGVRLTASGQLRWVLGNLGDIPTVTLDYRKYHAMNWTIDASSSGTTFTNDRTGRGMVVAVEGVKSF